MDKLRDYFPEAGVIAEILFQNLVPYLFIIYAFLFLSNFFKLVLLSDVTSSSKIIINISTTVEAN